MLRAHPVRIRLDRMRSAARASRFRLAATSAAWALRTYGASTMLMIGAGAAACGAAVPVAWIGWPGTPRLRLPVPPEADLGLPLSSLAWGPAASQWGALVSLTWVVVGLALAVAAVGAVTVLGVAAARAVARRREIVVRRSVGASRGKLRSSVLLEGLAMAGAALLLAGPLAAAAWRALARSWPGTVVAGRPWPAFVIAGGLAAIVALGACLPALWIPRTPQVRRRRVTPHGLVVPIGQFGVAFLILVLAGSVARRATQMTRVSGTQGFDAGTVFDVRRSGPLPQRAVRYATLLHRLAGDPSMDIVSLTSAGLLFGVNPVDFVTTDCGRCSQGGLRNRFRIVPAALGAISPDSFRAMGVRLLRGRGLGDTDSWAAPRVALVNESLASSHFEDGTAVGRKILLGSGVGKRWFTVVGVVEDRSPLAIGSVFQPPFAVYVSVLQQPPRAADLLIRRRRAPSAGVGTPTPAAATIQAAAQGTVSVVGNASVQARRSEAAAPLAWFETIARLEGLVVLAIATLGVFAVMDLWVRALLPELAVRRAVGARRRHVLGYVMARAAGVSIGGVALGLWLTEMLSGIVADAFGSGSGPDAMVILRAVELLAAATLVGAWIPAWRATRASPAGSLAELEP